MFTPRMRPRAIAPAPLLSLAAAIALALTAPATSARAQEVTREHPLAFDSAARIVAVTPPLVERLRLGPPAWPVTGDFREARLFEAGAGHVLVVTRSDGTMERYALDAAAVAALRAAIDAGSGARLSPSAEPGSDVVSEPAGFAFARNQLLIGLTVYGPTMAALASDGGTAGGVYLLSAGAPFFMALARQSNGEPITRAQNHLATDAGPRMAIVTSAAFYALTGAREEDPYQATVLAGAIGGTVAGLRWGRGLTDGEARAMTTGSTLLAGVTTGALGIAGRFDDDRFGRADYGVLAAAALAGYPLGLQWVRRARYGITAGDVSAISVGGAVGLLTATTFLSEDADDARGHSAILTAGLVGGVVAGDRLLARRFDYTRGEGTLLGVGAAGGALMGLALPILAKSEEWRVYTGAASLGAILGIVATHGMLDPIQPGSGRLPRGARNGAREPGRSSRVHFDPAAAALAAGGATGRHSILTLTF